MIELARSPQRRGSSGATPNPYAAEGFPAEQPVLLTLIWVAVMLAVFVPLAVRKYRSISR